jgi:predicted nucleic acid-binding protein
MPLVVDASALGAVAFDEPEGPEIEAHLQGETLVAPALIDLELISIALKKVRRGEAPLIKVAALLAVALRLPIEKVTVPGDEVFALAERTGLSSYDASYLWLARSRDIELVTLDRQLADVTDALGGPGASDRI